MDSHESIYEQTDLLNIISNQVHKSSEYFLVAIGRFIDAVNWTEPFVLSILIVELILALTTFLTRKHTKVQLILFTVLGLIVFTLPYSNTFLQEKWKILTTQNYFDDSVLFLSAVVGFPCFMMALFIVFNMTYLTAKLVIMLKRYELKQRIMKNSSKNLIDNNKLKEE